MLAFCVGLRILHSRPQLRRTLMCFVQNDDGRTTNSRTSPCLNIWSQYCLLTTPYHWRAVPPVADSLTSIPSVMYLRFFEILLCEERPDPTSGTIRIRNQAGFTWSWSPVMSCWRSGHENLPNLIESSWLSKFKKQTLFSTLPTFTGEWWQNQCGWRREMSNQNHKSGKQAASDFTTEFWSHAVCDLEKARNP